MSRPASRSHSSFLASERTEHAALLTTSVLAVAAVLALSALAAGCGAELKTECPPAAGSALGSPAAQSCGCFVQVRAAASASEIRDAVSAQLRATNPNDCLFESSGATDQLRSDGGARFSIAEDQLRPEKPEDSPTPQRIHYAVEYE